MTKQREAMREYIEKYPQYDSHYTRRDTIKKYLLSYLNIRKMYEEYKYDCDLSGKMNCGSYSLFTEEFRKTSYKFKQPKTDTCRTCDSFMLNLKQCKNSEEKAKYQSDYEVHTKLADDGYEQKRLDKESCIRDASRIVLVFDLQQVLDTPSLTVNISFYKRLL
ncbi:unnamed protein product [Psylliodes chrysocephalus]|uniref:Uncharacterized protein n=1 Tax=Psylliodes chrysocephalus TaxID=3402493 RepID=A0A9P0D2X5_9CUCU|nr:unnamed protein product [Psylliodes chrysocephala]